MRRLVCVKQTCLLTVSDCPLPTSCMASVLAFDCLMFPQARPGALVLTSHPASIRILTSPCELHACWGSMAVSRCCHLRRGLIGPASLSQSPEHDLPQAEPWRKHAHTRGRVIASTDFASALVSRRRSALQWLTPANTGSLGKGM
jgi:hypothetical protein